LGEGNNGGNKDQSFRQEGPQTEGGIRKKRAPSEEKRGTMSEAVITNKRGKKKKGKQGRPGVRVLSEKREVKKKRKEKRDRPTTVI